MGHKRTGRVRVLRLRTNGSVATRANHLVDEDAAERPTREDGRMIHGRKRHERITILTQGACSHDNAALVIVKRWPGGNGGCTPHPSSSPVGCSITQVQSQDFIRSDHRKLTHGSSCANGIFVRLYGTRNARQRNASSQWIGATHDLESQKKKPFGTPIPAGLTHSLHTPRPPFTCSRHLAEEGLQNPARRFTLEVRT